MIKAGGVKAEFDIFGHLAGLGDMRLFGNLTLARVRPR